MNLPDCEENFLPANACGTTPSHITHCSLGNIQIQGNLKFNALIHLHPVKIQLSSSEPSSLGDS